MESLFLCDGTPIWLQQLFSTFKGSGTAKEKALISALTLLMYECGFYLKEANENTTGAFNVVLMKELPSFFSINQVDGRYKMTFQVTNSNAPAHLIAIPLDSVLIVNLLVPDVTTVSEILEISKYIELDESKILLKNRRKLSLSFKPHIYLVKSKLLEDLHNCHHLFHLPTEVLSSICEYFGPKDFVHFGKTCKNAYALLECDHIWKRISKIYFPSRKLDDQETWKNFVKYQYELEHKHKKQVIHTVLPYLHNPFAYMGPLI